MAPIGFIFLWINKNHSTKTKGILTVVFGVWFIILVIVTQPTEEEKAQETFKQEQLEKEKQEEQVKKDKEEKEKEEKAKKEKERKANRNIAEKLQEDNKNVDKATFVDGTLTLEAEGKTTFSENTLFMSVYDLFEAMHEGFQDESVNEIYIELTTTMVDQKGNESVEPVIKYNYSRESFEELNYDKFKEMAYSEEWRVLTESDYYYIHPGIYKNLKDKYKNHVKVEGFK